MDPGKKRMITLKKSERDRKKLNESILKKLKTLDAEVAGASIVSWFLHSFSREPGITLSCSNGLWEPNSFMWSVWTVEKNDRSHKVLCALKENGTEITRGLSYLIKDSSFWITFICCKMSVAFCTLYQNFQQNKFLPLQDIIWPHFALLKQSHCISDVLLSWLLSGLSCIFWGSYIFVPPPFFSALRGEIFMVDRA